jgi:polyisoprenoid-binding protein YceI
MLPRPNETVEDPMTAATARRRWRIWIGAGVAAVIVAVVVAPWVYINLIREDAPAPLTLSTATGATGQTTGSTLAGGGPDGTWSIADGSLVGYRVNEVLFGQTAEAVGRTEEIDGSVTLSGTEVTDASFTVDMTTVASDEDRRDQQFHGRIMETSLFPTAEFVLTSPIDLGEIPAEGTEGTWAATGELTLHGVTAPVTVEVTGVYTGGSAQLVGSIPIVFADWNIEDPSFAGVVTTEDNGLLEFSLNLERA